MDKSRWVLHSMIVVRTCAVACLQLDQAMPTVSCDSDPAKSLNAKTTPFIVGGCGSTARYNWKTVLAV